MEQDLDTATLLDENLWKVVETKLMYINDPEVECKTYSVSRSIPTSSTFVELNLLLEQMGKAKFQQNVMWQGGRSKQSKTPESSLSLHREVDIQLQEVSALLEKFQEKVEGNEME